jgi:hypothetical protein
VSEARPLSFQQAPPRSCAREPYPVQRRCRAQTPAHGNPDQASQRRHSTQTQFAPYELRRNPPADWTQAKRGRQAVRKLHRDHTAVIHSSCVDAAAGRPSSRQFPVSVATSAQHADAARPVCRTQ